MTLSRMAAYAFLVANLVVHGVVAWLSPLQSNDWNHLLWARTHADDSTGAFAWAWLAEHTTFHDAVGFVLARSTPFHAIVTPLVGLALLWAMFVIAARRRPNLDDWRDVLVLVSLSALMWFAAPRAGVTWFHRPNVAQWVYGSAVTLWFLVPFRSGWRAPKGGSVLLFVAGFCAGSSSRLLALTALVLAILAVRHAPERARWMWAGLAGLVAGAVLSFLDKPQIDFTGFRPTIEATLTSLDVPIRECGEVISLMLGLLFAKLVLSRLRPATDDPNVPDTSETLRWLWLWFALVVVAMFGPKFTEASLLPASLALCIGTYPYLSWLANTVAMRFLIGAIVVGAHVIVWWISLSTYSHVHGIFLDRLNRLESGSGVVEVSPYPPRPTFWFFGEDFGPLRQRQLVATSLYDLQDIQISPTFRGYELPTDVRMRLEIDGVTDEQLRHARPPQWATTPSVARKQLEELVARLAKAGNDEVTARLVVDLTPEAARGRPILAELYERGSSKLPRVTRRGLDEGNSVPVIVRPASFATEYPDAFVLDGTNELRVVPKNGVYKVPAKTITTQLLVACNTTRCILLDAFVPRL